MLLNICNVLSSSRSMKRDPEIYKNPFLKKMNSSLFYIWIPDSDFAKASTDTAGLPARRSFSVAWGMTRNKKFFNAILICTFMFSQLKPSCPGQTYFYGTHQNNLIQCTSDGSGSCAALDVAHGGTGKCSLTAYAVLCGGTNSTAPIQPVASVGTLGHVLTSNGVAALPTFQTLSTSAIVTTYNVGSGNHSINANTKVLAIIGFGGGGGGGSGKLGGSFGKGGGGGGGAGGMFFYIVPVSFFGGSGSVIPYVVGAGGTGGAGVGLGSPGNNGSNGGITSFGFLETSNSNNFGSGATAEGSNAGGAGGIGRALIGNLISSIASGSQTDGGAGGGASGVIGTTASGISTGICSGTGGGGGGRGNNSTSPIGTGGAGGAIRSPGSSTTLLAGGTAGIGSTPAGGPGQNNTLLVNCFYGGTGGGGGRGGSRAALPASGGAGGVPGGAGGGGGGGDSGTGPSGAGGNGGDGILYVIEYL